MLQSNKVKDKTNGKVLSVQLILFASPPSAIILGCQGATNYGSDLSWPLTSLAVVMLAILWLLGIVP